MGYFLAKNPNPVIIMGKDGTICYSNRASEPLLHEWGVEIGEKLTSYIGDLVQGVISKNSPEKIEVKVGKRVYLVEFHPPLEEECIRVYGFDISDQKELEEKIRKSEEKYRIIVETANEGMWVIDSEDRTIYINNKTSEMIGYSKEEMIGRSMCDFTDKEDKDISGPTREKRWQSIGESHEFKFICKDGSPLWALVNTKSFCDNDGKFTGYVVTLTDITRRKEAEEKLKGTLNNLEKLVQEQRTKLEEAYNSLIENDRRLTEAQKIAHLGNWDWDLITGKVYWSDELYRIFGLNPQEFSATYDSFLSYIHPDDQKYVDNAVKIALNGKPVDIDYRIILTNGEKRTVHEKREVIFDETNIPARLRGTLQDITESKETENELELSEERYLSFIQNFTGIAFQRDGNFNLEFMKGSVEEITGYTEEELMCKKWWKELIEKEDLPLFLKKEREAKNSPSPYCGKLSYRIKCKDGKIKWVHEVCQKVSGKNGKPDSYQGTISDVTERIKAKENLIKIENARKKEIHHRIKNNLQVISSLLDLQAEKFNSKKTAPTPEILEAFRESQNRVISMSLIHEELYKGEGTDTLDFSAYLRKLAGNLFQTYSLSSKNIHLYMDLEENALFNMDTAVPLGIIVNELVSNSLKHAFPEKEGKIRIQLKREEKNNETHEFLFSLTISDNGKGISENMGLESPESLGLQLVSILVDQLDGKIELTRTQGTEFRIRFNSVK